MTTTAPQRADTLTVHHHDDTVSHFSGVLYHLSAAGIVVVDEHGAELQRFGAFDVLHHQAYRAKTPPPEQSE